MPRVRRLGPGARQFESVRAHAFLEIQVCGEEADVVRIDDGYTPGNINDFVHDSTWPKSWAGDRPLFSYGTVLGFDFEGVEVPYTVGDPETDIPRRN